MLKIIPNIMEKFINIMKIFCISKIKIPINNTIIILKKNDKLNIFNEIYLTVSRNILRIIYNSFKELNFEDIKTNLLNAIFHSNNLIKMLNKKIF